MLAALPKYTGPQVNAQFQMSGIVDDAVYSKSKGEPDPLLHGRSVNTPMAGSFLAKVGRQYVNLHG